jgi:predicted Rossmann-fold nucleotide-binding protein
MNQRSRHDQAATTRRTFLARSTVLASIAALSTELLANHTLGQLKGCGANMPDKRLRELSDIDAVRNAGEDLKSTVVKGVDLTSCGPSYWQRTKIHTTFFLGCRFDGSRSQSVLEEKGAIVVPRFEELPYEPFQYRLYSPDELLRALPTGVTVDQTIYCDYISKGRSSPDVVEALCRRIHDDGIDDALDHLVREVGATNFVAFMGGSSNKRTDPFYKKTAQVARLLALDGHFVVSGGGPGMMEAANLGGYFAKYTDAELEQAFGILGRAPEYGDKDWIPTALEVKSKFPHGGDSLGIPTWFYGFEPTNAFATHIAKYFDNSIREGGLTQIGKGGIIFAPGSAGTRQEIFMDAAQNHYGTTGFYSPMIFLGKQQYQIDTPVYPLIQELATANYKDLLFITDEPTEIVKFIRDHKPVPTTPKPDPICGCLPSD